MCSDGAKDEELIDVGKFLTSVDLLKSSAEAFTAPSHDLTQYRSRSCVSNPDLYMMGPSSPKKRAELSCNEAQWCMRVFVLRSLVSTLSCSWSSAITVFASSTEDRKYFWTDVSSSGYVTNLRKESKKLEPWPRKPIELANVICINPNNVDNSCNCFVATVTVASYLSVTVRSRQWCHRWMSSVNGRGMGLLSDEKDIYKCTRNLFPIHNAATFVLEKSTARRGFSIYAPASSASEELGFISPMRYLGDG